MIRILDKDVADKIAAGEVIERPLSVVKELVENAIDAMPGSITVEIEKGGKNYIRVTDNGTGIDSGEVETAFRRHATSKLETVTDLDSIGTLGFRGEALPSIAAVSRVEVITKTRDSESGRHVVVEGGKLIENSAIGAENGTTVIVKDLFYNTPARQKFMRSDAAEATAIIEFVSQIALAYTNIKFRLINNGNSLFTTRGTCDRGENMLTIYGRREGDELVKFNTGCSFMEVEGYVSNPGHSLSNRKQQIFFVNGRVISSKTVSKAVANAYSDRLFSGRYPVAYIFISIDPLKIDVNVHPNKKEIKFLDEKEVEAFLEKSIKQALQKKEAIPNISNSDVWKYEEITPEKPQVSMKEMLTAIREEKSEKSFLHQPVTVSYDAESPAETEKEQTQEEIQTEKFDISSLTVTGSVFSTYITAKDSENFYFIDQHAAHERVFFEKLLREYRSGEKHVQPIMIPFTVDVPFEVKENENAWIDSLVSMGYDVEMFGPRTYRILGIPAFMELSEGEKFVNDFIENCSETTELESSEMIEKIIMRSCKSAIKANDEISDEEIHALIKDLASCDNPFSCPHGRPTFIRLSKREIEKLFKRI